MIDFLFLDKDKCYICKSEEAVKFTICNSCLKKLDYVANKYKILDRESHSIYFYNDYMAKLIADYKFNRNTSLYKVFGQMVYDYGFKHNLFDFDYILPVPSSKKTINKRGFDHIKLICDFFIDKTDMNYLDQFKKIKNTRSQHTLSLEERNLNLKDAFFLDFDLDSKSVLIFDDIITTSNTVKEIIKVLDKNNVGDIKVLALSSSHKII